MVWFHVSPVFIWGRILIDGELRPSRGAATQSSFNSHDVVMHLKKGTHRCFRGLWQISQIGLQLDLALAHRTS
jgi:hypothetical protein